MDSRQTTQKHNGTDEQADSSATAITLANVNRVLEVGQLLAAVLTSEELSALRSLLDDPEHQRSILVVGDINR
jgi:hypothetical protein